MATAAPMDMRTHGYYCPHGYTHSWLLLPLWIYALIAATAPMDMRIYGYYCPHGYAHSWLQLPP